MLDLLLPRNCAGCDGPSDTLICPDCTPWTAHRIPPPSPLLRGAFALQAYGGPLGRVAVRSKRQHRRRLGLALGNALGHALRRVLDGQRPDAIVPVPSPWTRQWLRGFQPGALLAAEVGRTLDVPVVHALSVRPGPRQSGLDRRQRSRALRPRLRSHTPVPGRVLLIDDVVTTGATADQCAVELLGHASDAVWLATVCTVRDPVGDVATGRD